jgi:hypothetical protein
VDWVKIIKFPGIHITKDLTLSTHTHTVVKRAQQHHFPLRSLKRFGTDPRILKKLYSCTNKSILLTFDRKELQREVLATQYITGAELPVIQDLYIMWCQREARKTVEDASHPSHGLFTLLPSGKWYRSIGSRTNRLRDSFYPQSHTTAK